MYPIEKQVAIPDATRGLHAVLRYPFATMEVGDSFLVPWPSGGGRLGVRNRVNAIVGYTKRRERDRGLDVEFTTRSTPEGMRVWRVR